MNLPSAITRYPSASALPDSWDALCASLYQRRTMLEHAEATHPCDQRYYLFQPAGRPTAGAVVYSISLDLLTYRGLRSPFTMQVIGLPCSVGWPGLVGQSADLSFLIRAIRQAEPGFLIGLNTLCPVDILGLPQGDTLPCAVFERPYGDFAAYRSSLRSDYRRRLDRARSRFVSAVETRGSCAAFDQDMHRLYLQAWERSKARLEILPERFFAQLPEDFRLTVFRLGGRLLGWHICSFEPGRTTFFMGGVDQELLEGASTYHNLLFSVLEQGFEAGSAEIDLGQTAETAKTRLGAVLRSRGMFALPRSGLVRALMHRGRGLFAYRHQTAQVRVFRESV